MTITKLETELYLKKNELKEAKQVSANKFRKQYKSWFLLMDLAVLLMFLFNMGALVITNALVVKVEPDIKFYEANPVAAKNLGLEEHPDKERTISKMFGLLKHFIILAILLFCYIWQRNKVYNTQSFNYVLAIVIFYFVILGADFFNDFGYLLGVGLYG